MDKLVLKIKKGKFLLTLVLFLTGIIYFTQSENFYVNSKIKKDLNSIFSDGTGYYAYLPATFIYGDYRFQFLKGIKKKYDVSYVQGVNMYAKPNEIGNKYYIGTSVLMSPFFLTAGLINKAETGDFGDGYSKSFQKAIRFSGIFYGIVGLIFLFLFLQSYSFSRFTILFILLAVGLGTSLNFYSTCYPSFSHSYSFATVTCFFYLSRRFALSRKSKQLYLLFLLAALVIIIRPTNGLVLLIFPFLFNGWGDFTATVKTIFLNKKLHLLLAFSLFSGIIALQLINIYLQTNSLSPFTYGEESFAFWKSPKMIDVLLSYKKGLLTYTPLLFLMIPGLIVLFRRNSYLFWGWLFVFLINLYLISSWWCWWYGGGLGMRPFIDLYVLLIIPIAFLLEYSHTWIKVITAGAILFAISIYQIYQYQFNHDILHYEKMNKETFWQIFLSTSSRNTFIVSYQNEPLPKTRMVKKERYYYNPSQKKWAAQKKRSTFDFGVKNRDSDIYKTFCFNKTSNLLPAFQISADFWIKHSEVNPNFLLLYFKAGQIARKKDFFIGSHIKTVEASNPITITINPKIKQSDYDSVVIFFQRNSTSAGIRNLKIDYLLYEAKIKP